LRLNADVAVAAWRQREGGAVGDNARHGIGCVRESVGDFDDVVRLVVEVFESRLFDLSAGLLTQHATRFHEAVHDGVRAQVNGRRTVHVAGFGARPELGELSSVAQGADASEAAAVTGADRNAVVDVERAFLRTQGDIVEGDAPREPEHEPIPGAGFGDTLGKVTLALRAAGPPGPT